MDDDAATPFLREEGVDRGRGAEKPTEVPPRGWKDVLVRVKGELKADGVSLLAAGVAFYALLALVPSLVALVSVYGLVANPEDIQRNIEDALAAAPTEVRDLVSSQLSSIVESEPSGLRLGVIVGLVVALWSASAGMKHLIEAINLAYAEDDERGFIKLRGLALLLTVGGIALLAAAVGGLIVLPNVLGDSGGEGVARTVLMIVRWPLLAIVGLLALSVLYRWAPDREAARWRWVSAGALFATVGWVIASIGFSIYTSNFGQYNETYGALGAIVVVMLWLYITAFVIIAGAELNAELERQTAVDSTTGPPRPLGERNAYAADTVGRASTKSARAKAAKR
jgi:membrane protein